MTDTPAIDLDAIDRAILNALQDGFPITARPFEDAGNALGIDAETLIARLRRLHEDGTITRFGPFYDAAALGGAFCLCAMAVPAAEFDTVAAKVNAHREVAHNYERTHHLNMWFVIATERPEQIAEVTARIEEETGITVFSFPKLQEFFINFRVAV